MNRILIIDDHQSTLEISSRVLRLKGFATATAASGGEGMALAMAGQFDVILVDLRLPDLSGVELVKELKARGCQARMVIVTAFPDLESSFDAALAGAAGYVDGPLFGDELFDVVRQAVLGEFPVRHPVNRSNPVEHQPVNSPTLARCALPQDRRVRAVVQIIESEYQNHWTSKTLGEQVRLSDSRLRHLFTAVLGVSPAKLLADRRLQIAAHLLRTTGDPIEHIVRRTGLGEDLRRFRRAFRERFRMLPLAYRARFNRRRIEKDE